MANPLIRRDFLKQTSAAALGATLLPAWGHAAAPKGKTKHVLLVAFAGGVRTRDTLGSPNNVPNMMRLAKEGVVFPNTGVANLGHYGATLSIFTGNAEVMGIREDARGYNPTVFEYLREGMQLPASQCWLSTNNGSQAINFAYSLHRKFGPEYGANVIDGDSLFNEEFREILDQFGRPRADQQSEFDTLSQLRGAIDGSAKPAGSAAVNDSNTAQRVEKYILDELSNNRTTRMTGPGAADAKALQIAGNILQIFRPKLLGVSLSNADIAHGSYNGYVDVIRRNDQQLGRILEIIDNDPQLKDSTAVFVLPEFGRDRDLNARNGLDHGDGSTDLQRVATVCWGPDFKRGSTNEKDVKSTDVCPTICSLFGIKPKHARGRVLPRLLA